MAVSRTRLAVVVAVCAAALSAQVAPGDALPWPGGAAAALAGTPAATARCVVWRSGAGVRAGRWARDESWFAEERARRRLPQFAVVAVVPPTAAGRLPAADVVVVDAADAAASWFRVAEEHVVVTGPDGVVRFVGSPGAGLDDAVDDAVAGRCDLAGARLAHDCRRTAARDFDAMSAAFAEPVASALAHAPRDGLLHALRYLVAATKADAPAAARTFAADSVAKLTATPQALAVFVDVAVRGAHAKVELAAAVAPAMAAAAATAPADFAVQLAHLRVLGLCGEGRAFGRQAVRVRRLAHDDGAACLELAAVLADGARAPIYGDFAAGVVARAADLQAEPRWLAAARFAVAWNCRGDAAAAQSVVADYTARAAHISLNNDCWYLLTDLATSGRFDPFAAALADVMAGDPEALDYFECDTVASAYFAVGRTADAVAFAARAVARGGADVPAYGERLRRYQQALATAVR